LVFVVDADCLVAATIAGQGAAFDLLDHWRDGDFELVACPHLLEEVKRALGQPRVLRKYGITLAEIEELVKELTRDSVWLDDPVDPPRVVTDDPGDDYLVALALAASADALITRDRHFDGVVVEGLEIAWPGVIVARLRNVIDNE
jgi:putative PIN family toxin of toxin-antitoxin system